MASQINNLENALGNLCLDSAMKGVPVPRWQRKALETSTCSNPNISLNGSVNRSYCKTPKQTPSKKVVAKGRVTPQTPHQPGGDRFIPVRSSSNLELGQFKLKNTQSPVEQDPSKVALKKALSEQYLGISKSTKILSFQDKPSNMKVAYCGITPGSTSTATKKSTRFISHSPDQILDAPGIYDDYYLNYMDWSSTNLLAIALRHSLYLWNAATGDINNLLTLDSDNDYIGSVAFAHDGCFLAVGTSKGEVLLYDVEEQKRMRTMRGESGRIGSLSWNEHVLSAGSKMGRINHHDVRCAQHLASSVAAHRLEVCGLRWSPDGKYLASGGNDNTLKIWTQEQGKVYGAAAPLHTMADLGSTVKAMAWCPFKSGILATGGGNADRRIRIWSRTTGQLMDTIQTGSQISALVWNTEYKELASSHGAPNNEINIWKYPANTKVTTLSGHGGRILNMISSPDGTMIATMGADETLKLWKCFAVDDDKKKKDGFKKPSTWESLQTLR